jgi:hypothetical protein
MMLFITIFASPAVYIYSRYSALAPYSMLSQFSLGNMGGASIDCDHIPLSTPDIALQISCPQGTIQSTALTSDGTPAFSAAIIPSDAYHPNYCDASAI